MTVVQLLIGALTVVTNALFVAAEFALVSVRRSQVEPRADAGERRARTVIRGLEHVSAQLATAQLGVTASSLVLGAVAEPAISHLLEPALSAAGLPNGVIHALSFAVAVMLATYVHMLFGEMVPKNIALAAPQRTALLLVPALVWLTHALRPLVYSINAVANGVLHLMRAEVRDEVASVYTGDDLARLVEDSSRAHLLAERDTALLQEVLDLGRRPVREVLRPLSEMVCAEPDVTPQQLERLAARTGYSRFPVRDGADLTGYLHVKDVLGADPGERFAEDALRPIARIDPDTPLDDVLDAMRGTGAHLAVAIGDDGRPAGLVTMRDVLTGLVGSPTNRRLQSW